jgi:hypothetical protein
VTVVGVETISDPCEDVMLAYDDSPCWFGSWAAPDPARVIWAQSAVSRTVRALPELHPMRLGDDKGTSGRVLAWCGIPDPPVGGLGVLTQLSPPPEVGADDEPESTDLVLFTELLGAAASEPQHLQAPVGVRAYRPPEPGVRRWAGAVAQIAGTWLPPVALLARSRRDLDDPATGWSTESLDFARRYTVHAADPRLASDLLAPHVIALILDGVPSEAAVTVSGDALHLWWPYDRPTRAEAARVSSAAAAATTIAAALPSFVLADHPDRSGQVEDRLETRAAEAAAYRAARDARLAARRATS